MALNLGSILVKIIGDNTDLNNKLNEAEKQAQGFAKRLSTSLTKAGTAMTLGVTLPLVGVGVAVGKIASDFEAQMAILEVAARNSGESVEELRAVALKAGADTSLLGINASETADAITGLYKAGLTSSEIFGDLEGYLEGSAEMAGAFRAAVDLAAASDLELAAASDAVAIAMATFGLSGEDAVGIANSFVRAADASVAEVSELTQALANVGPTAAQFGWSLDDTNTALALLSERGIRGSEAGTALKSMMTNLMRPTEDVVSALANLNIKLYDQEGHLKSLPQLVGELEGAMDGLTEEQRNQTIQAIAGTYGMKAMSTLLAEGAVGWDEMTKAIGGAATAQEVAEVRMDTFAGVMEAFKGTIETFMIQAGTPLLDNFVRPLIERLTVIIGKITEADPKFFELGVKIALAAAAAGPLLLIAGKLIAVIGMIASPVGLAVAALGLLALAWKNNWGGIRDKMLPALEEVKGAIAKAWPVVSGFVSDVTAAFKSEGLKGAIEEFKAKWPELTTGISEAVGPLVEKVKTWLDNVVSAVKTWVAENAPKVGEFLKGMFTRAMETGVNVMELAVNLQERIYSWMSTAIGGLTAKIPEWTASLVAKLQEWMNSTHDDFEMPEWATRMGELIRQLISNAITFVGENLVPLAQELVKAVKQLVDLFLQHAYDNLPDWGTNFGGFLGALVGKALVFLTEDLPVYVAQFITWVSDLFDGFGKDAEGSRQQWGQVILGAITNAWNAFKEALIANGPVWVGDLFTWIETTIQGVVDKINAVKEFFSNFKTIGAGIVEGIKQGIEDAKDGLKDFIMDFLRRIVPGWAHTALGIESPSKVFAEIGYSMADGLGVGLVEGMAEVIPAMEQVMGHIMAADAQMGGSLAMPDVHVPAIASGVSPPLSDVTVGGWIATIGNGGAQAGDLFAQRFAKSAIESPGMRTFAENMVAMLMDELTNYVDGGRVL